MADTVASPTLPLAQPPSLVGRDRERASLQGHLAGAFAGRGGLVLIAGEAGIGKTALTEVLLREAAEQGALVLVGRCYDLSETSPYGPWVEAFEQFPTEFDRASLPAPFGDGAAAASQTALFTRVRDFLAALSSRQPLVLLLDDLHWADPAVVEELLRLVPDYNAAVRQLPGLQHFHGGLDRATGKGITVAIFDTEEHARHSFEGFGEVSDRIQATGLQVESVEYIETVE